MAPKKSLYTINELNQELNELYNYLKQEKWRNEEIAALLLPITSKLPKKSKKADIILQRCMFFAALALAIYGLTYSERFYWHLTALTRIGMIKMLPYFDWRHLKNEPCLISKFSIFEHNNRKHLDWNSFNCDVCEGIRNIDAFETIDEDTLIHRYIDLDVPVILTKGIEHWIKESRERFFDYLLKEGDFSASAPCRLETNVVSGGRGEITVRKLIEKTEFFDRFFVHFQNCEKGAMRAFRTHTYRPEALPESYSPIVYNWLLWNKNYNSSRYKKIDLVEKITIFGQIFGGTYVKLVPRGNCEVECPILNFHLNSGEYVIFTGLWDLEYKPFENGEHLAAILEAKD